jgi:hypothetical protein
MQIVAGLTLVGIIISLVQSVYKEIKEESEVDKYEN